MIDLAMYWTGVIFWAFIVICGLIFAIDAFIWKLADTLVKKYDLQKDLFAFCTDRWQKRSGKYPG